MQTDHKQRAAGERPEDHPTDQERRDYWIARCHETLGLEWPHE